MKNIKIFICALCVVLGSASCSDMLESESTRQVFDPELSEKTDSIFYALGILQGMQQLADQYVFQGEMRGDLVDTTHYTDNNLRQLANFTADASNKYDSAYVYYRVINNCNYYIAHRDTMLRTGSTYVVRNEYAAIKAIRAWAYMQLARVYGKVPFYTEPLTQISQIDRDYPELDMNGIVAVLAPDLEQYAGSPVPNFGNTSPNSSIISPSKLFIPVDIVLGDMYLETNQYAKAANAYIRYLTQVASGTNNHSYYYQPYSLSGRFFRNVELPNDWTFDGFNGTYAWQGIFSSPSSSDIISYIPMGTSSRNGKTTVLPITFGYDLYSTSASGNARYTEEIQLAPSQSYLDLSESGYQYYKSSTSTLTTTIIGKILLGDTRYKGITHEVDDNESETTTTWITKYNNGFIILYRNTTVLLHLAEAFNRLGMPDAAFAILKDGINTKLISTGLDAPVYISDATREALQITYPILSSANLSKFESPEHFFGVHSHGAGYTRDYNGSTYEPTLSPYNMDTIVAQKFDQLALKYNLTLDSTTLTKADTINAIEDILCDEYALEFSFEGTRFFDLCRLARHKNESTPAQYGANFGNQWLADKLAFKNPAVSLLDEKNWYLPFK